MSLRRLLIAIATTRSVIFYRFVSIWVFKWWVAVPPISHPKSWSCLVGKPMGQLGKPTILGNLHLGINWFRFSCRCCFLLLVLLLLLLLMVKLYKLLLLLLQMFLLLEQLRLLLFHMDHLHHRSSSIIILILILILIDPILNHNNKSSSIKKKKIQLPYATIPYPSSHNHESKKMAPSYMSFLSFGGPIFHWTHDYGSERLPALRAFFSQRNPSASGLQFFPWKTPKKHQHSESI